MNPRITPEEVGMIKRAQAGDESAFNALFHRYKGFVDNLLFQYIKDMDEAKDVTNIDTHKIIHKAGDRRGMTVRLEFKMILEEI